jgi:hypothetical protein
VLALCSRTAERGVEGALEWAPLRTDVETLFASVRAFALAFQPPRAPGLSTIDRRGDGELVLQFDSRLRPSPTTVLVCGERREGTLSAEGDALTVAFDETRCLEVDGVRIVSIELGGSSSSPRGLDGAIVRHTFARAETSGIDGAEAPVEPGPE